MKLFETGVYGTIDEMATAERINGSYICRILRLTLLVPDIVEALLYGRQPKAMTLTALMRPFPAGGGNRLRHYDPSNSTVIARHGGSFVVAVQEVQRIWRMFIGIIPVASSAFRRINR